MQMTEGEIRRKYKSAQNKKKQIDILAELNGCSTGKIIDIVHSGRVSQEEGEEHNHAAWQPTGEQQALMDRLDELDAMIKPLEVEYRRTTALLMEIGGIDAGRDIRRDWEDELSVPGNRMRTGG